MANFYNFEAGEGTSEFGRVYFEKILKNPNTYLGSFGSTLGHLLAADEPSTLLFIKEVMSFLGEDHCKTTIAYEFSFPAKVSVAFPKNSPFHEIFNYGILKMMESGYLESMLKKHLKNSDCYNDGRSDKEDTNGNSLGLVKLSSLFVIIGAGIVLSAVTLTLETVNATVYKTPGHLLVSKPKANEATKVQTIIEVEGRYSDGDLNMFMIKWGISDFDSFRIDLKELLQRNPGLG